MYIKLDMVSSWVGIFWYFVMCTIQKEKMSYTSLYRTGNITLVVIRFDNIRPMVHVHVHHRFMQIQQMIAEKSSINKML